MNNLSEFVEEFSGLAWVFVILVAILLVLLIVQLGITIREHYRRKAEQKRVDEINARQQAEEERLRREHKNLMSGYTD